MGPSGTGLVLCLGGVPASPSCRADLDARQAVEQGPAPVVPSKVGDVDFLAVRQTQHFRI